MRLIVANHRSTAPSQRSGAARVLRTMFGASALLVGMWGAVALAGDSKPGEPAGPAVGDACGLFDHRHSRWSSLLRTYVADGNVDYSGLKARGQADLNGYLQELQSVCRGHYDQWSREQKLAFWINAYNAYTVRLVLDHYPLKSIRSIGFLPMAAFREQFIPMQSLRGRKLSLNDLEHEILRKEFDEPRIHFGIVCASKSCPPLKSEAYRSSDLDRQLDEAARFFLRNEQYNRFDAAKRTLHLSSIFKWFREDFEKAAGSLPEFVARYADETTASAIRSGGVKLDFLDYDWSLNGK